MQDLRVTLVQSDLVWENPKANMKLFSEALDGIKDTDLIILPEMFNTGFSMASERLAETMDGPTVLWLKEQAATLECDILGSLIIAEDGAYYNRLVWAKPDGSLSTYNKRHLFRMADEHHHFAAGNSRMIVELNGWRICPQVCYDLRFPVWSRNKGDYDALIYIANWPEARNHPWSALLVARAIENQAYVIGVNRVGTDGKGISYSGDSIAIDAKGNTLTDINPSITSIETVTLSMSDLTAFREKFPVGKDADEFDIKE
jgi:omega-amidase